MPLHDHATPRGFAFATPIAAFLVALMLGAAAPAIAQKAATATTETITVGIPKFWPPHYIAEGVPEPTGFAVEIFDAVAARAGYRIDYRIYPAFKLTMDALYAGKVDVVPNVGVIPARERLLKFTDPVETFVVSIFVRADTQDIAGLRDLYGRRAGSVARNVGIRIMKKHPKIKAVQFNDIRTALFDLLAGRIDGLLYPAPVVIRLAREIGIFNRIKVAGPPLQEVKRAIAVNPARAEVHRRLAAATRDFVKTTEYQRIYTNWFGKVSKDLPVEKVLTVGGIALALLVLIFSVWHYLTVMRLNRTLERRVEERTAALRDAQDELVRKERLATLGKLTGTMAHELRNPLGTIVTAFEIIKHRANVQERNLGNAIARAERGIQRCTKIISELLDYAQVKQTRFDEIAVDRLVADTLDEYQAPDFIAVERRLDAAGGCMLGDADQLHRLLINFLDNGRDAIVERSIGSTDSARGTLRVAIRSVDGDIEIVIADDGVGIAPDQLEKIFEPLYSTKSFGVGLGLPNARNIVDQFDGEISLKSEPGKGTEAIIRFPAVERSAQRRQVA